MGLFNYIKCDMPLPSLPEDLINKHSGKAIEFQTKDLPDTIMRSYLIDKNGELFLKVYYDDEGCETYWSTNKETGLKLIKYAGSIRFYDCFQSKVKSDKSGWIEYEAVFLNGLLQGEIKLIEMTKPSNFTEKEIEENKQQKKHSEYMLDKKIDAKMEKINQCKLLVNNLSSVQDELYNNLLSSIGFQKSDEKTDWIFDYIYNEPTEGPYKKYLIDEIRKLLKPF
jgi:hypothetical protein